jgi:hypothetical protein
MVQANRPNQFFKYTNLALQMGLIIGLSTWGGDRLDSFYKNITPIFTIILSLGGIALAFYLVLRDFIKPKNHSK